MLIPPRFWIRPLVVVSAVVAVVFFAARWTLTGLGLPATSASALAAVAAVLDAAFVVILGLTKVFGRFPSRARVRLLTGVWAAMVGVLCAGATAALFGLSAPATLVVGLAAAALAAPVVRGSARKQAMSPTTRGTAIDSLHQVDEALEVFAAQLADPSLDERTRAAVELDWAAAQSMAAMLSDRPDHLDEALLVLERHARAPQHSHAHRFRAVCELVETRDMLAERSRDDHGWEDALALQRVIADEPGAPEWERARCLHDLGDRHVYLAREAGADHPEYLHHLQAALDLFRESLRGFGSAAGFAPFLSSKIAQQLLAVAAADPSGSWEYALDDVIRDLRQTLPLYRGHRREGREFVGFALAQMLLLRVEATEQLTPDVDEAERLCRRPADLLDRPELCGTANEVLAEAIRLRLAYADTHEGRSDHRLRRQRVEHLRRVFLAHRALRSPPPPHAGLAWAEAAAESGDVRATAAAYAEVARQVPVEVLRRLDADKRSAFVAARQGIATEAGYWLGEVGEVGEHTEAVRAVEYARAILLGLLVRRLPDDTDARLQAEARLDLRDAYRSATRELQAAERVQYAAGERDPARLQRAWSRFDRLTHAVGDVVGDGAVDEDGHAVARRVAADGAVVYLGAAARSGYALIVPHAGAIRRVRLPGATRAELDGQVAAYAEFLADPRDDDRLSSVLAWLWTAVLAPIVADLPPGDMITLVPLGGLGLLPLHAAGEHGHYIDDHVVVRYAPSARLAERARSDAAAAGAAHPTLAVVSVPVVAARPDLPTLVHADVETRAVANCYGVEPGPVAGHADTLAALATATVWHLGCHGRADPQEPLNSSLALADEPLTLRRILATVPGVHRLAVLSACETAVPDRSRPDEVLGFPGAFLQAGVAGVVASGWRVRQDAAAALVVRVHELWRAGASPAAALTQAQRWLRTVTRGELHDRFGDGFGPSPGTPDEELEHWRTQRPFRHPRMWGAFTFTGC
jgi:CHAT domain-containing protein